MTYATVKVTSFTRLTFDLVLVKVIACNFQFIDTFLGLY